MLPIAFIGGALAGAAGLAAAAIWDKNRTEARYPDELKNSSNLDEKAICQLLNDYYLKANLLAMKVSNYEMENHTVSDPILKMPDETIFERTFRIAGNKITPLMRKWRVDGLMALKKEAEDLYGRYRPAFKRANELLKSRGRMPVDLRNRTFKNISFALNNTLENEDWDTDFDELADKIRKYLDDSANNAQRFVEIFEGREVIIELDCAK